MAEALKQLLGDVVVNKEGAEVPVESLSGDGKVLGLYFSALWCPPCRAFTPKLAEFYNKFKKTENGANFNIVFLSSDQDESKFKEYFNEMPWLACPYQERDLKDKVSKKFKVPGIPTLIFLDGADGKTITSEGRNIVIDDPEGKEFPWRPKPFLEVIQGPLLKNKTEKSKTEKGKTEESKIEEVEDCSELIKDKTLGIYFSAHWCPPCRGFTPTLVKTYKVLIDKGKDFEIIFASSDRSKESFEEYFDTMPWLALPFGDSRKNILSKRFGVQGIPTLIILDKNGEIITSNGREVVAKDPQGENFPWRPEPLEELSEQNAHNLNEETCVVYFTDGESESIAAAKEVLEPIAKARFEAASEAGESPSMYFFYTGEEDDIGDSLRDFAGLPDEDNILVLIDIPGGHSYLSDAEDITQDVAKQFIEDYEAGKLKGKPLRK